MRILVSGANGLIGAALVECLRARGDEVGAMVRPTGTAAQRGELDVPWDPAAGTIDAERLAAGRFDAVVHLAGESILGRWNDAKRERIRASRVVGTTTVATAIAAVEATARPSTLICASATGFYGDRGEELLSEGAAKGTGFLADVVEAWEAAADPAREAGVRVAHLRMSAVQSPAGGALKAQLLPFRLGLGGPVGNGRNWTAWVGLTEVVRMICFALDDGRVEGVLNAVGPTPATAREYARALGRTLHRPAFMAAPTPIVRLAMGQVVDELVTASQKVVPTRLEALGYEFLDRTVNDALRRELGRS